MAQKKNELVDTTEPITLGVQVCDTVIEDKESSKRSLIGLFDSMWSAEFPTIRSFYAVVSLTNLAKQCNVSVRLLSPDEQEIVNLKFLVKNPDPTSVSDFIFNLNGVPLPIEGIYWIKAYVDDKEVGRRPLRIFQLAPGKGN